MRYGSITRRRMIGAACFAFMLTPVRNRAIGAPGASSLTLTLTIGGTDYVFGQADATDVGDYAGEHVQQRCYRGKHASLPDFTVFFRPDADGSREEVVIEYGGCLSGTPAHVTAPYKATIRRSGQVLASVSVPYHWWQTRWRWQSARRPVVRPAATLRARNWILPYGKSGLYGAPTPRAHSYAGPMDVVGLEVAMGAAGDRYDIGPVTEWQADYLLHGTPSSLSTLLAQGEACASMPFHFRDEMTGAAIDVQRHPQAGFADDEGNPAVARAPRPLDAGGNYDPRYFQLASTHMPAAAYLPYALTDDPFFLEELEAQATYSMIDNLYHRRNTKLMGLVYPGAQRGFAWGLRHLFQLGAVAPLNPPSWLKPRSYWKKCVADNRKYMQKFMDAPTRVHRVFRAFPRSDLIAEWQNDFLTTVLAHGILLGFPEWQDAYAWLIDATIKKASGASGWNRQWPAPYYYSVFKTNKSAYDWATLVAPSNGYADADRDTCRDWAAVWALYKASHENPPGMPAPIDDVGWDGHTLMQDNTSAGYYVYLRASLAMAARLKIPGARASYDYIASELPNVVAVKGTPAAMRWSLDPP